MCAKFTRILKWTSPIPFMAYKGTPIKSEIPVEQNGEPRDKFVYKQ